MRILLPLLCCAALAGCHRQPAAGNVPPGQPAGPVERSAVSAAQPDLAEAEAAPLIALPPVKLRIPGPRFIEPPDFVAEGGDGLIENLPPQQAEAARKEQKRKDEEAAKKRAEAWKQKFSREVTLPAHVFPPGEGRFPLKSPDLAQQPGYVWAVAVLKARAEASDWEGMKAMMGPDKPAFSGGAEGEAETKETLFWEFSRMETAEIPLILEVEGVQLAFLRTPTFGVTLGVPLARPGDGYRIWNPDTFSPETKLMVSELTTFLMQRGTAQDLLVK